MHYERTKSKKSIKISNLNSWFLILSFWSYEISTILSTLLPSLSISYSEILRLSTVFIGLVLIIRNRDRAIKPSLESKFLIVFLLIYLIRLFYDFIILNKASIVPSNKYILIHLFSNLLPVIFILFIGITSVDLKRFLKYTKIIILSTIFFAVYTGVESYIASTLLTESARLYTDKLSPIQLGHLSVTLFLIVLMNKEISKRKRQNLQKIIIYSFCFMGLVFSNSKGPIVSLIVVLIWLAYVRKGLSIYFISKIAKYFISFLFIISISLFYFNIDILNRFYGITKATDVSTASRLESFKNGFEIFLSSPLIGGSAVLSNGGYPHNFLIELLLSTGILGLLLFTYPLFKSISVSKLYRNQTEIGILSTLLVQYLVAFQFSFSLFQASTIFIIIAILINRYEANSNFSIQ